MPRPRSFFRSPFVSALLGALLAVALGLAAVTAGLVDAGRGSATTTTVASAPLTADARPAASDGSTIGDVYEEDAQGVAFIEARLRTAGQPAPFGPVPQGGGTASGSGFLIDDSGHVLTNAHVVDGASSVTVKFGDGDPLPAKVLGADDSTDVAVLSVDAGEVDADPLRLGDSAAVRVGDAAVAIGNPYGLDRTVTAGIISALQRQISAPNGFTISDVIQTDAAISPGNSGGPLIDANGRVIGINSQIATGSGGSGSVGIGFAVPIDTAREVARQIIENGEVQHAYLGMSGTDVTPGLADVLNFGVDAGALVQTVVPGGPAARAGLEGGHGTVSVDGQRVRAGGDVITAIDGEAVTGMDDLISTINARSAGDEVTLEVLRDGSRHEITVELGDRPASARG